MKLESIHELRCAVENIVYQFIQDNTVEINPIEMGLDRNCPDPLYVTRTDIIISEEQNEKFKRYAKLDGIQSFDTYVCDGYVFYKRQSHKCRIGVLLNAYWKKDYSQV